ncbi:MAG: rod shape-determining protein MreD [Alphaproteobacteria bacterium]|nr:rod shape-determining protein MreD [Alphaproteobacteria bacterium]OJV12182.1 MAG: rod shape-determining protein MreD [Alphaproteobacteria bacterium 33-17]
MNPKIVPRLRISFFLTSILFVFLSLIPVLPEIKPILPSIVFILIFLLTLVYSNMIPDWYLLLLGIVSDVISGKLIGTTAFCYLIVKYIIMYHRKRFFSLNFVFTTIGFIVTTLVINALQIASSHFLQGKEINFHDLGLQIIASILVFPFVYYLFVTRITNDTK